LRTPNPYLGFETGGVSSVCSRGAWPGVLRRPAGELGRAGSHLADRRRGGISGFRSNCGGCRWTGIPDRVAVMPGPVVLAAVQPDPLPAISQSGAARGKYFKPVDHRPGVVLAQAGLPARRGGVSTVSVYSLGEGDGCHLHFDPRLRRRLWWRIGCILLSTGSPLLITYHNNNN